LVQAEELGSLGREQVPIVLEGAKRSDRNAESVFVNGESGSSTFIETLELRATGDARSTPSSPDSCAWHVMITA
jgi:hypothetical protein